MKMIFLSFLLLSAVLSFAQSEEKVDVLYEVSDLYHKQAGNFTCEYVKTQIDEIKDRKKEEISKDLQEREKLLREASKLSSSEEEKAQIEKLANALKDASLDDEPRGIVIKGLESICKSTYTPLKYAARTVGLVNGVVINTATMPIRSVYSFFKGLLGRGNSPEAKRDDFLSRALGPKHGVRGYALGVLVTQFPDMFLHFNPTLGMVNLSLSIEMVTNYQCYKLNPANKGQANYCRLYSGMKDFFHASDNKSQGMGKRLQRWIDKKKAARNSKLDPAKFCSYLPEKEVESAKKALERAELVKNNPQILNAELILPIHKNRCTKILISADASDLESVKSLGTHLEGVEIVYMAKGKYPNQFYYTNKELSEMTFAEQLCHDVERETYGADAANFSKFSLMKTFIKSAMAPNLLGEPESQKITMKDNMVMKGDISHLRNLIFSIGSKPEEAKQIQALSNEGQEIIKDVQTLYEDVMKTKDFQSCQAYVANSNPDLVSFREKLHRLAEIKSSPLLKENYEGGFVKSLFEKSRKHLKLDWELIPTNDMKEVMNALKSHDVSNIIILSHGKASGHLSDVLDQEYPRESFSQISPSILSLNFYSCHSQKLIKLYDLENKIKAQNSFYKIRYLTNVKENNFLDSNELAPVSAFGYYLRELDSYLADSLKGAQKVQDMFSSQLAQETEEQSCSANLEDIRVKKGSYAVTINDRLIGNMNQENDHQKVTFPCSYMKAGENVLRIKNVSNQGRSEIENLDDFTLEIHGQTLSSKEALLKRNSMITFKFNVLQDLSDDQLY